MFMFFSYNKYFIIWGFGYFIAKEREINKENEIKIKMEKNLSKCYYMFIIFLTINTL